MAIVYVKVRWRGQCNGTHTSNPYDWSCQLDIPLLRRCWNSSSDFQHSAHSQLFII